MLVSEMYHDGRPLCLDEDANSFTNAVWRREYPNVPGLDSVELYFVLTSLHVIVTMILGIVTEPNPQGRSIKGSLTLATRHLPSPVVGYELLSLIE